MKLHNTEVIFFVTTKKIQNIKPASTRLTITPIKYFSFPKFRQEMIRKNPGNWNIGDMSINMENPDPRMPENVTFA